MLLSICASYLDTLFAFKSSAVLIRTIFLNQLRWQKLLLHTFSRMFRLFNTIGLAKKAQFQSLRTIYSRTWTNYNRYYHRGPLRKLKKPALFTAAFCAGTTLAAPYVFDYTPFAYFKRHPQHLVYTIIALNGAMFAAWRVPQLTRFMTRYGLFVKDSIASPWSMLGLAFSHQSMGHLFVNMFVLHSFGTSLSAMIGAANFATMYLNSAVIASFLSLAIPTLLRTGTAGMASLGASGAVFSVFGTFSYLIPKASMAFFFVPVPGGAWVLFLGTVAYNVAGLALRWGRYDYAAHIGGSIAGVAYGWWYKKKMQERRRRRVIVY